MVFVTGGCQSHRIPVEVSSVQSPKRVLRPCIKLKLIELVIKLNQDLFFKFYANLICSSVSGSKVLNKFVSAFYHIQLQWNRLFTASLFSACERKCQRNEREVCGGGGVGFASERARRNREAADRKIRLFRLHLFFYAAGSVAGSHSPPSQVFLLCWRPVLSLSYPRVQRWNGVKI